MYTYKLTSYKFTPLFTPLLSWSWSEPRWIILVRLYSLVVKLASVSLRHCISSWSGHVHWKAAESGSLKAHRALVRVIVQLKIGQVRLFFGTCNCLVDYYGAVLVFTLLNRSFLFSPVLLLCSCIWKAPQWALRLPQHRPVIDTSERV